MLARAMENAVLSPRRGLWENFAAIGGGNFLCESKYGCFIVVFMDAGLPPVLKAEEERIAAREFRAVARRQKFFVSVVKNFLPMVMPVVTFDPDRQIKK